MKLYAVTYRDCTYQTFFAGVVDDKSKIHNMLEEYFGNKIKVEKAYDDGDFRIDVAYGEDYEIFIEETFLNKPCHDEHLNK